MARTRPDAPKLLPQEYGRANYLRREVQLARDYQHLNPEGEGAAAVEAFFDALGGEPAPLPDDQTIVEDGDTLGLLGEAVLATVSGNELTLSVASTLAFVEDGDTFAVDGGTVTLSVVDSVVTASFEPEE